MVLYQIVYTIEEAAKALKTSETRIREFIDTGSLKCVFADEYGKELLIPGTDLEKFVEALTRL